MTRKGRTIAVRSGSFFIAALGLIANGCPGTLEEPSRFTMPDCPPGTDIVTDIFEPNCGSAACHGNGIESAGGLDLISAGVESRVLDVASSTCVGRIRVDSSDIDESFLLEKLQLDPECGDPMPQIGVRLSRVELACTREWVESLISELDGGSE